MFEGMTFNPYMQGPFSGFSNAMGMQAVSQPAQPQNNATAVLYAPSAKEFSNVTVQPGRQALVISQNDPYIAFKSADAMGMVSTTLYKLEPVTADQINTPVPEYATKDELSRLENVVQQIVDSIMPKKSNSKKEDAE